MSSNLTNYSNYHSIPPSFECKCVGRAKKDVSDEVGGDQGGVRELKIFFVNLIQNQAPCTDRLQHDSRIKHNPQYNQMIFFFPFYLVFRNLVSEMDERYRARKSHLPTPSTPDIDRCKVGVPTEWQVCSKVQLLAWLGDYTGESVVKFESLKDGYLLSRAVAIAYQHSPGQIAMFM